MLTFYSNHKIAIQISLLGIIASILCLIFNQNILIYGLLIGLWSFVGSFLCLERIIVRILFRKSVPLGVKSGLFFFVMKFAVPIGLLFLGSHFHFSPLGMLFGLILGLAIVAFGLWLNFRKGDKKY